MGTPRCQRGCHPAPRALGQSGHHRAGVPLTLATCTWRAPREAPPGQNELGHQPIGSEALAAQAECKVLARRLQPPRVRTSLRMRRGNHGKRIASFSWPERAVSQVRRRRLLLQTARLAEEPSTRPCAAWRSTTLGFFKRRCTNRGSIEVMELGRVKLLPWLWLSLRLSKLV